MSVVGDFVTGLISPLTNLYANRQKRLAEESAAQSAYDKVLVDASAADAAVAGQIALVRIKNANNTWKDEYALIVISGPFVVTMVLGALEGFGHLPVGTTEKVTTGMFTGMSEIPEWWSNTFQAGMLSALGVTLWNKAKGR